MRCYLLYHSEMWCKKSLVDETPGHNDVGLLWSLLKLFVVSMYCFRSFRCADRGWYIAPLVEGRIVSYRIVL